MTSEITDNHTLYLHTGGATQGQVEDIFRNIMEDLGIKSDFRLNVVVNREGKLGGWGYAFVRDTKLYNLMIGKNEDGTDRVKITYDRSWTPPSESMEDRIEQLNITYDEQMDALDVDEELSDDEYDRQAIRLKYYLDYDTEVLIKEYTRPHTTEELEPLIDRELLKYDSSEHDEGFDYIDIKPFIIYDNEEDEENNDKPSVIHNVLLSRKLPTWVTVDDIKKVIDPLVTSRRKIPKGRYANKQYPIIEIREPRKNFSNDNRIVYIRFDPKTDNARFALPVIKVSQIIGPDNDSYALVFSHQRQQQDRQDRYNGHNGKYQRSPGQQR